MTHDSTDQARTYSGVTTSGIVAVSASGLGLLIITVIGTVSEHVIPVGLTGMSVAGSLIGTILIINGFLLRRMEQLHVERGAELRAMELDRIRREYAREPIVAAGLAEVVLEEVRPLVATLHEGVVAKVQRVTEGLSDLLEELRKIRVRQAHADEALVAVEVEMKELEALGERVAELERELSQVADAPVTDIAAARALRSLQRRLGSED